MVRRPLVEKGSEAAGEVGEPVARHPEGGRIEGGEAFAGHVDDIGCVARGRHRERIVGRECRQPGNVVSRAEIDCVIGPEEDLANQP